MILSSNNQHISAVSQRYLAPAARPQGRTAVRLPRNPRSVARAHASPGGARPGAHTNYDKTI
eukprot:14850024-Heterocapsa_arctica.AAC.1